MVDKTRSLWKRQSAHSREKFDMPSYDVMQEDGPHELHCANAVGPAPTRQINKLVVHAPTDPGMLSYISQPVDAISPHSLQSPNAIRAGWAGLVTSPKKTSLDENVPPHPVRANQHQFKSSAAAASKHRRMGTWSHASDQLTGAVRHERSGSGEVVITGSLPPGSPRQACGYELPGPSPAWVPPPPSQATFPTGMQQPHESASLISWDEPDLQQGSTSLVPHVQQAQPPLAKLTLAEAVLGPFRQADQQQSLTGSYVPSQPGLTSPQHSGSLGERSQLQRATSGYSSPQQANAHSQWAEHEQYSQHIGLVQPHYQQQQLAARHQKGSLGLEMLQQLSQQLSQQPPGSNAAEASCQADSFPSSGSDSPERTALVPQGYLGEGNAAAALPERLPAFTQPRGPLVPEHSFEVNTVW